jgi:hypothetical protein
MGGIGYGRERSMGRRGGWEKREHLRMGKILGIGLFEEEEERRKRRIGRIEYGKERRMGRIGG